MRILRLFIGALAAAVILLPLNAAAKELNVGLGAEPTSIDPHYHNLGPNNAISESIYDRLINQNEKQQLKPGLAVSWKAIDDTTWIFNLRKGVKFHDGTDFSADDVIFTFERAPTVPNSPSSFAIFTKGKTLTKVDDYTIQVKTDKPHPLTPNDISQVNIISKKAAQGASTEDFNSGKAAIGTGPFKFIKWVPGDRLILQRNDNYWGPKPEWAVVNIRVVKSSPARVAALLSGDVDFIDNVPTTDIARLKKEPGLSLSQGVSNRVIYLHMDQFRDDSPFVKAKDGGSIKNPLKDVRVRQAISKAINRDLIVERVMEGVAIPAGQLLPEGFFGVSPNLKPEKYDPEGAKRLLAEAGVPDGFQLTIHGPNDRYINDAKIAEAIAQMLTRVGIKTAVETMPKSVYFKRASRGGPNSTPEFSFILVGWGAGTGEASSPLKALLHTYDKSKGMGATNRGRYSNPKLDELTEKALATVDDAQREKLLQQATELAMHDYGIIPLHYQVNTWAARKGLKYTARTDEHTDYAYIFSK
jgi:peptide/nickel transport system substrate-binding protein